MAKNIRVCQSQLDLDWTCLHHSVNKTQYMAYSTYEASSRLAYLHTKTTGRKASLALSKAHLNFNKSCIFWLNCAKTPTYKNFVVLLWVITISKPVENPGPGQENDRYITHIKQWGVLHFRFCIDKTNKICVNQCVLGVLEGRFYCIWANLAELFPLFKMLCPAKQSKMTADGCFIPNILTCE